LVEGAGQVALFNERFGDVAVQPRALRPGSKKRGRESLFDARASNHGEK
jgi:hypothetical protein